MFALAEADAMEVSEADSDISYYMLSSDHGKSIVSKTSLPHISTDI
jgi:hypothetical protein